MSRLGEWLGTLGLSRYADAFEAHAIAWDVLPRLDHELLKEIGVRAAGDRIRILDAIAARGDPAAPPEGPKPRMLSPPESRAERRQLTVMFCDLVGSTELAHRLDPEDLGELMAAYQGVCRNSVARYDGYIARYSGDGVLVYFGYPQAHEEDAERAVRSALTILDGMRAVNARLESARQPQLSVRIGIATGPVVVGDRIGEGSAEESAAIGETPNVAARLQALAAPDTIVIGPETRRLAQDYFEYEDRGEQHLKGLDEAIRAWRVVGERAPELRFEARRGAGGAPLVGRADELALLVRRWQHARDGEGQIVLLRGEPGIGKSRLAQSLRERLAREPHMLVRYQCSPYHSNSTLFPVAEQLRRAAGMTPSDPPQVKLSKLDALLLGWGQDVAEVGPLFAALLGLETEGRYPPKALGREAFKEATLRALTDQLARLAATQPVLLILEDAHWIDPTTREALDLILPAVAGQRVLAVITFRPEFRPPWSALPHALTLPLTRLSGPDAARLSESLARGKRLPPELLAQILAKADGVPLFLEEITKSILESGLIVETDDGYRLTDPNLGPVIPATLHDSLMARLDRAAAMREVAQVAACLGRQFSRDALAQILEMDEATLAAALAQLEEGGLLYRLADRSPPGYAFKHALVRDAAYDSLLKGRRRQLHGRIAALLCESAEVVAAAPETIAQHFMSAEAFEEAASYWALAAERAGAGYANAEAIAHCRNGLAAAARMPPGPRRAELELKLRVALAAGLRIADHHEEALVELGLAEAVATESGQRSALSRIHHLRGNLYYPLGRIESCLAEHEAALDLARQSGSIEDEARALGGIGDAHFLARRVKEAHQQFEESVALARAHGLTATEVAYLPMRAVTHMYCLRFGQALDDCEAVARMVVRVGPVRGALIARSTSSWIHLDRRELALAEEHARDGLETTQRIGARRFIPLFKDVLARLRLLAGDRAGALALLDESWEVAQKTGVSFAGPVVLGAIALATDDPARRSEVLQHGEAILNEGCASHNHLRFYRDAIEACVREGLWEEAIGHASTLERWFPGNACPWADLFIALAQALGGLGLRAQDATHRTRLRQLREFAASVGLRAEVSRLDATLWAA